MTKLAFIGGGGFAKEVLEIAELNDHRVVGYCGASEGVLARPYWGDLATLLDYRNEFEAVVVAFGAVDRRSLTERRGVIDWILKQGLTPIALVSPHAVVSKGAQVAAGSIIGHRAVIGVDARIESYVVLNIGAIIGHDVTIGRNVVVAPGAFIGGSSAIGEDCLIGPSATVLQGLHVGAGAIVGMGASVVRDVAEGATVWPLLSKVRS